jgi:ABC-type sugar transport system substrate-binding protein
MGEKGMMAILAGNQRAPNLQNRVGRAKEALQKYPNMKLNDPAARS